MPKKTVKTNVKVAEKFVKEVIARLSGDKDEALANRNARLGVAAVDGQLAALTSSKIKLEVALEDAEEELKNATFPTTQIDTPEGFILSVSSAKSRVKKAEEELENIDSSIDFYEELYQTFF